MLFILQVIRIIPMSIYKGSIVDIVTPYGIKPLVMVAGEATRIRVSDFNTTLGFVFKQSRVSHSIVTLLERPKINFALVPLTVDISLTRVVEDKDKHFVPIGHRGSGSNEYRKKNNLTFIPENSILSFQHAYESGANWVEMDLSITSDGVVVVYHDFKINDNPIWNMTLKLFKSSVATPTIFESVFTRMNPDINLAVEIKYPSVEEIESENLGSVPNLKHFVKQVIEIIRKKNNRKLIINSYEPDVLVYLKKIAPDLDVFLNTEGVPKKFSDSRRNSLEEGIGFCLEHDLQGIVTDSETITSAPLQYTTRIHSSGLQLIIYFYRSFSKETDYVQEIIKFDCAGVDGILLEDVTMAIQIVSNMTSCFYNNLKHNYSE